MRLASEVRGYGVAMLAIVAVTLVSVLSRPHPGYSRTALFVGAVASYQDIPPLKDLKRLREEFIATATHELRSPITVIKGQSQLALIRDATEELARRTFETIIRQSNRMAQIIDDVLLAARMRPKGAALKVTGFDLRPLVAEVVATMSHAHLNIQVDTAIEGPVDVNADRVLIGIAIARLLNNAVRYSPSLIPEWHETHPPPGALRPRD